MEIECPTCHKVLYVDQEWLGKKAQCPCCGKVFIVTRPEPVYQARFRDTDQKRPNSKQNATIEGRTASPTADLAADDQEQKACPLCGRMIKADAKFCRFCRKDISKAGNFKVKCPRCAETFELDYGSDCRKVNCPFCGHNFQAVSEKQENWSSASNGLYISLLTLGMTVLSAWFVAVACMIAGIVYSVIALFKFHDHPDKKYKEYAEWGIVANIFAFCIGIAIKMVISSL